MNRKCELCNKPFNPPTLATNVCEECSITMLKNESPQPETGQDPKEGSAVCPCTITEPCSVNCTCANGFRSGGCSRCCTYGSREQQEAVAKILVAKEAAAEWVRKWNVQILTLLHGRQSAQELLKKLRSIVEALREGK